MEQTITAFIAQLMRQAGFDALPEAQRQDHQRKLRDEIIARFGVVILEQLSSQDRAQYLREFVETERITSKEAKQFLASKLPQLNSVLESALRSFAQEYLKGYLQAAK